MEFKDTKNQILSHILLLKEEYLIKSRDKNYHVEDLKISYQKICNSSN